MFSTDPRVLDDIVKAYDVRGTVPDQVNTEVAYALGRDENYIRAHRPSTARALPGARAIMAPFRLWLEALGYGATQQGSGPGGARRGRRRWQRGTARSPASR